MGNKMETLKTIQITVIILLIFTFGLFTGNFLERKCSRKIIHVDLDETYIQPVEESSKYPFMAKEYSDYISKLADELKIDSDLVVSILMVENPEFNPDVTHRNNNGTNDLGFFQLNDRYCYSVFVKSYWDMDVEFNPYNWKHNTFIAMHHIEYLLRTLKIQNDAIMAYNCGINGVISNNIPASTRNYLARVQNNYKILKKMER